MTSLKAWLENVPAFRDAIIAVQYCAKFRRQSSILDSHFLLDGVRYTASVEGTSNCAETVQAALPLPPDTAVVANVCLNGMRLLAMGWRSEMM